MSYCNEPARRQLVVYAECFAELLDVGHFPDLTKQLIAVWCEFNDTFQRYLNEKCEINAFAMELEILGEPRFRHIKLPNCATAPLYLGEAASEDQVRRNPSIILGLPRKRRAIDRLNESTRREAS